MRVLLIAAHYTVEALDMVVKGALLGSLIGFLVVTAGPNPPLLAGLVGIVVGGVASFEID